MSTLIRLFAVFIIVPSIYIFVYWLAGSLLFSSFGEQQWIAANIVALFSAAIAGWYVWKKLGSANSGLISNKFIGAIILGAISFSAGFFGPLIFAPESNQGPLLGILITGPLGIVLGGIAGGIYWTNRRRNAQSD